MPCSSSHSWASDVINARTIGDAAVACSAAKAPHDNMVAKLIGTNKIATARPVTPMIPLTSYIARLPCRMLHPEHSISSHRDFTTLASAGPTARITQDSSKYSAQLNTYILCTAGYSFSA